MKKANNSINTAGDYSYLCYRAANKQMLDKLDGDDIIFLVQIHTLLKKHLERKGTAHE